MTILIIRNTILETISHNGKIWFTSSKIARALQYSSSKSVTDLYNKNSDEFADHMSQGIESTTSGPNSQTKCNKVNPWSYSKTT